MEDVRKRIDLKMITVPSVFKKHAAKVTYKRSEVFVNNEDKEHFKEAGQTADDYVKKS